MRHFFLVLTLWCLSIYGIETDFDCIVVGTSPISMFEAIYHGYLGEKVLVVESAAESGGAWKSINICGISKVDLGCHEFGNNPKTKTFLEEYAGCEMKPPETPKRRSNQEIYPSRGCYELTHNLERLMEVLGITLMLKTKLESVYIDTLNDFATVNVSGARYTTHKILVTHASEFTVDSESGVSQTKRSSLRKYPHVYLLVSDPTPCRFTYIQPSIKGISRAMNLTKFVELEGSGKQLITVQVHSEKFMEGGQYYLNELKRLGFVDQAAHLLYEENYIYQQASLDTRSLKRIGTGPNDIFEILDTSNISNIANFQEKWKKVMKPWKEIMGE